MIEHLAIMGLALAAALVVTPLAGRAGVLLGAVDRGDGYRKLHPRPVPMLGGLAVFSAYIFALFAAGFIFGFPVARAAFSSRDFHIFTAMALFILTVGAFDDIYGVRARWKLLWQLVVAVIMYYSGFRIAGVTNPFGGHFTLGWFAGPLTVFWFLGCMNAINLIDGLDGLAAGISLFAVGSVFATGLVLGNVGAAAYSAAFAGALLGFLKYNFHPASIFLGDSGSYLLGFMIAAISIRATQKSQWVFMLLVPVIALGIPIIDTFLAMLRRWSRRLPISFPDRQHLHHRLSDMGLSHRKVVLLLYFCCLVLAGVSLLMVAEKDALSAGVLLILGVGTVFAVRILGKTEISHLLGRIDTGRRRRKLSTRYLCSVQKAKSMLKRAKDVEDVWRIFCELAPEIGLNGVTLEMPHPSGDGDAGRRLEWKADDSGAVDIDGSPDSGSDSAVSWTVSYPICLNGCQSGEIKVSRESCDFAVDSVLTSALEDVFESVNGCIERLIAPDRGRPGSHH